jgi:hypothetical protein
MLANRHPRLSHTIAVLALTASLAGAALSPSLAAASPQGLGGSKAKPTKKRATKFGGKVGASKVPVKTGKAPAKSGKSSGTGHSNGGSGKISGSTPTGPTTPTAPTTPTVPTVPTVPTAPIIPAPPVIREEATGPEIPSSPGIPTSPETPTAPIIPTTPTVPTSPTSPIQPSGTTLFSGAKVKDYWMQQAAPSAITEVPDPLGSGASVLKMTVSNSDIAPITPTDNPRAQLLSPEMLKPGQEFWMQEKFLIPADMPSIPGWMSLMAIYGPPFNGTGPWDVEIAENELRWQRNNSYKWDIPWRTPLVKGQWTTITVHMLLATSGWVEMWINGQPIKFFSKGAYNPLKEAETQRLAMKTMDSSNSGGPNSARIMQYREAGMFQNGSVYFGALKVGTTLAAVQ